MQATPLISVDTAIALSAWVQTVWPGFAAAAIAVIRRRHLPHRVAYVCLGWLMGLGITYLVGLAHAYMFFYSARDATGSVADRLVAVMVNYEIGTIVASVILSAAPLWWLYNLLAFPRTPNNRIERTRER